MVTKLIVHTKKGTRATPGSLVAEHSAGSHYVFLPNGDAIGIVYATTAIARKMLEAEEGVTVLPPLHRPIKDEDLPLLEHAGVVAGEIGYDVCEKLFLHHRVPWFHPESTHLSNESINDLLPLEPVL
jgi:hypothetical protein